jgi:hypothetical protein
MKNARGSKSAPTTKPPTLVEVRCAHEGCAETTVMPSRRAAKGTHRCPEHSKQPGTSATDGPPEVTINSGTTLALLNPADAPAPPKAKRSKKVEPTVALKAEVPDWAKRAATRDTAAEMAAVSEAAPVAAPTADAAPEAAAPKKGRAPKATERPAANVMPTATPGSLRAIGDAWLASLRNAGHTPSTVSSYGNDLEFAYEHLGADTAAGTITEKQIAGFNASKGVVKKANGKPKAQPTILKTRRALRLALVWAANQKLIAKAPYSAA